LPNPNHETKITPYKEKNKVEFSINSMLNDETEKKSIKNRPKKPKSACCLAKLATRTIRP